MNTKMSQDRESSTHLTQIRNTFVSLTPHDLTNLITRVTTGVSQRLQQQTPVAPIIPTPTANRTIKFPPQSAFNGKPKQLELIICEAELQFSINDQEYTTPERKAYYLLSLFSKGSAKLWKGKRWRPRHYASKEENYRMEIDRLEPQEEKQRKEQGLCFTCGKAVHHADVLAA
jgi:hypothetical protein